MYDPYDDGFPPQEEEWRSPASERAQALLENLTDPQRESVLHRGSPLVILAGAGTGKTTALTRRIGHIIASGDGRPEDILAVTFTNKAARELEKRLKKLLDDDLYGLTVGTFHAVCARMLRENAALFGVSQDYVIMDSDDQKRLVKRLVKARFGKLDKEELKTLTDEIMDLVENVRGNPSESAEILGKSSDEARNVYYDYEQTKREDGVLDFTDLLSIVTEAFRHGTVDPQMIAGRWKHILVDEYQDTNGLQFEWLQHIVGDKPDLAVVGDDDQVLYSWRGARIDNILTFHEKFENTKVIRLEQNFRSTGLILDAANGLIAKNKKRLGKTLFTTDERGQPIHLRYFVNAELEAQWIVAEIRAAIASGVAPTDIAVLSRASHALNLVEQKLTWAGVPYVLSGGKRFQDKAEVRDAMAYLRLAANPDDSSSFERVVNTPKRGMGDVNVKRIIDAAETARKNKLPLSLMDVADNFARSRALPGDVPAKLLSFVDAVRKANTSFWRGAKASELLEYVLKESGYTDAMAQLLAEAKSTGDATLADSLQVRSDNIADLLKIGVDMEPLQLVEHLGLSEDGRSKNATGVWVGTIHAAKGLEWPMVIGVAWEDNVLPSWQALSEGPDLIAEERRCAYVQITRARRQMTITTTGERFQKPAIASRFLSELPAGAVVRFDMQPPEERHED
jgi:DNA helicase-2/ATP-dependent DNA helicase PcrA